MHSRYRIGHVMRKLSKYSMQMIPNHLSIQQHLYHLPPVTIAIPVSVAYLHGKQSLMMFQGAALSRRQCVQDILDCSSRT